MDRVARVATQMFRLPLPSPIHLGHLIVRSRDYVVVEVETTSGLCGQSWAISRGAPIDLFIERFVTESVVGAPIDDDPVKAALLWRRIADSMTPVVRAGSGMRALSLVDIALWDLRGQVAAAPIWSLLGGSARDIPVLMVAGYVTDGDDLGIIARAVAEFSRRGHPLVKIACATDDAATGQLLRECVRAGLASQTQLVVDAAWRWSDAKVASRAVADWAAAAPVAWVEDPFRDAQRDELREFRALSPQVRVGVGDESSDPDCLRSLVNDRDVDVLRIDLTTIGGYTAAVPLVSHATGAGLDVSPHLYPEMSVHLASSDPTISHVETFDRNVPAGNPLDPMHLYVTSEFPLTATHVAAPTAPGLGARVDITALAEFRA